MNTLIEKLLNYSSQALPSEKDIEAAKEHSSKIIDAFSIIGDLSLILFNKPYEFLNERDIKISIPCFIGGKPKNLIIIYGEKGLSLYAYFEDKE